MCALNWAASYLVMLKLLQVASNMLPLIRPSVYFLAITCLQQLRATKCDGGIYIYIYSPIAAAKGSEQARPPSPDRRRVAIIGGVTGEGRKKGKGLCHAIEAPTSGRYTVKSFVLPVLTSVLDHRFREQAAFPVLYLRLRSLDYTLVLYYNYCSTVAMVVVV